MTLRPGQRVHWEKDGKPDRDDTGTVMVDGDGLVVVWDRHVAGDSRRDMDEIDADGYGQIGAERFRAVPVRGER